MTTQQFVKGLLMTLVGVVVTAVTHGSSWAIILITLIGTALVYTGKNAIPFLHSDSPAGELNFKNILSALLIAIGTGIVEAIATIVQNNVIDWVILGKVVLSITFTYLGTTLFSPEHNTQKTFKIINMKNKTLLLAFLLLSCTLITQAQPKVNHWDGFFKNVPSELFVPEVTVPQLAGEEATVLTPDVWLFRPAVELSAVQLVWNKESKKFDTGSFTSAGVGLSYQHYISNNGEPYNNFGVNALLLFDITPTETAESTGIGVALTATAYQYISLGAGYNITNKTPMIIFGVSYNFNK